MKREEINQYIKKNFKKMDDDELADACGITTNAVHHRRRAMRLIRSNGSPVPVQRGADSSTPKLKDILKENADQKRVLKTIETLKRKKIAVHKISAAKGLSGEATIIALASDWHVEEQISAEQVNQKNEYNLQIAKERVDNFFRTLLRLIEIERKNTKIKHLVLALLGDFITGNIHEDAVRLLEENEALAYAQELIVSGLKYLLENSDLQITVVCHSGNHARITKKQHISTEHQHSQEWLMYKLGIEPLFRNEKRMRFVIPAGYHSYLDVYDMRVRFHHGHQMKFGGGVGGITIPVNKAINEWNKVHRVDLDCFGHFHQAFDGGNFVCNGSLIGFNAYALSIKASPEPPQQMFIGIHSKLGKYITRYIKCASSHHEKELAHKSVSV